MRKLVPDLKAVRVSHPCVQLIRYRKKQIQPCFSGFDAVISEMPMDQGSPGLRIQLNQGDHILTGIPTFAYRYSLLLEFIIVPTDPSYNQLPKKKKLLLLTAVDCISNTDIHCCIVA